MLSPQLPPPEKSSLRLGYIRLSDSAPLILAQQDGWFERLGLEVELVREVSWANLRDRLLMGDLDAAQLLAPLPMMTTYGAGGMRANLLTGLTLSLNGNAIVLSSRYWPLLAMDELSDPPDALKTGQRLKQLVDSSAAKPSLTFATVHLFSMHTILLRMWLSASGIDPDNDVRIIVLPPEQMSDSLARGIIDGYCVGEPWGTISVERGTGFIVSSGYQIWNNAPEKVLGVTEKWHHAHNLTHLRLRIALMQTCDALKDQAVRKRLPALLAEPGYLDLPETTLAPSLNGDIRFSKQRPPVSLPDFHVFGRYQAGFPWRSSAEHMVRQSSFALAKPISEEEIRSLCQQCYRTDLYREACRYLGWHSPASDYKPEGKHNSEWLMSDGTPMGADRFIADNGK